jgi:3-hydroxyisobutyrate dehydrogenase-like beta-hydroxyacid dehydrogenase
MHTTIAVIAMGEMGAAVAQRLVENGARVVTNLAGRSPASAGRAAKAGVTVLDSDRELIEQSSLILSILPPSSAAALAARLFPFIRVAASKPLYADCNAVAPSTLHRIAAPFLAEGLPFVDASIIGMAPVPGTAGPRLYASGEHVAKLEALRDLGVDVRAVSSELGDASALKMSYAGITKGFQALGSAMVLGASRAGVTEAFVKELAGSQSMLLGWLKKELPVMYPKAHRWIGEMHEISAFLQPESGSSAILAGAANLYEAIARDQSEGPDSDRIARLNEFVKR